MFKPQVLAYALSVLITSISAAPTARATMTNLDITSLRVHWVYNQTTVLTFNVQDESPVSNITSHCTGAWPSNNDPTGAALKCTQGYTCSVSSWTDDHDFSLHFSHTYEDPSIGQPDILTVFANVDIAEPQLSCSPGPQMSEAPAETCLQASGTVIKAPITSAIAKK